MSTNTTVAYFVCSSFLTSSNMSKNFTEAEGRRYKGRGFHCPLPKLRFSFVSKKTRSRTVSYTSLYICAPMASSSLKSLCQCILPIQVIFVFLLWFVSAIALTLYLQPFNPQPLMVENNGVEPLTSCVQGRRSSQLS